MIEQKWNESSISKRWDILDSLGLSCKIRKVDNRLFEELPQQQQKWLIDASAVVQSYAVCS